MHCSRIIATTIQGNKNMIFPFLFFLNYLYFKMYFKITAYINSFLVLWNILSTKQCWFYEWRELYFSCPIYFLKQFRLSYHDLPTFTSCLSYATRWQNYIGCAASRDLIGKKNLMWKQHQRRYIRSSLTSSSSQLNICCHFHLNVCSWIPLQTMIKNKYLIW